MEIPKVQLSPRERQILRLLYAGLRTKQIADELCIRAGVVSNYLHLMYRRVGVSDALDLVMWGMRAGELPTAIGCRCAAAESLSEQRAA